MTTNNPEIEESKVTRWPSRAAYPVGNSRRQRQKQYKQQMNFLVTILSATVIVGSLVVILNWSEAGNTKAADCLNYPQYCVPFAGGSGISDTLEAAGVRKLEANSEGIAGVIRYIDENNVPTIGDPAAPIHFRVVANFACSHCNDFHDNELERFIKEYVLKGKATFGSVMVTGMLPEYTTVATQGALCAGEQGAFWEMSDELYRLARTQGYQAGFSVDSIHDSAKKMGLDASAIDTCIADARYLDAINEYSLFSSDYGVTGTPTVLMRYSDSEEWVTVTRSYQNLAELTDAANAPTP